MLLIIYIINEFIMIIRKTNELDQFIGYDNNKGYLSPRNVFAPVNAWPQDRNISPNKLNATRKPMISPARSSRLQPPTDKNSTGQNIGRREKQIQHCCSNENHRNKKAEYIIHVEDQDLYYCGICATQAASQGFHVSKIENNTKVRKLPQYPKYLGNKRYQKVIDLLKNVMFIQQQYRQYDTKSVRDHYANQKLLIHDFYEQIFQSIQKMKEDQLQDLQEEERKNMEFIKEEKQSLKSQLKKSASIWEDIEQNMCQIVQSIDDFVFKNCMDSYAQLLQNIRNRMQKSQLQNPTNYSSTDLKKKIQDFQNIFIQIWHNKQQEKKQKVRQEDNLQIEEKIKLARAPVTTVKNVHEMLPKSNEREEGKTAYRSLFGEEEPNLPQASPQFKAF